MGGPDTHPLWGRDGAEFKGAVRAGDKVGGSSALRKQPEMTAPKKKVDLTAQAAPYPLGRKGYDIAPGTTVLVETLEEIKFTSIIAGFGFPPAHLARNAILMANPGHVDPGYSGKLSFTLINMGRDEFTINQGMPIVTLLIFKFDNPVEASYAARRGVIRKPEYAEVLNVLAPDFGNYTERMAAAAEKAVALELRDLDRAKLWIPTNEQSKNLPDCKSEDPRDGDSAIS